MSPHCGPCHGLLREVASDPALRERVDAVLAVSNADPESNAALAAEAGIRFPLLTEERRAVSRPYAALALPSFCVVDSDGRIAASGPVGDIDELRRLLGAGRRPFASLGRSLRQAEVPAIDPENRVLGAGG